MLNVNMKIYKFIQYSFVVALATLNVVLIIKSKSFNNMFNKQNYLINEQYNEISALKIMFDMN